MMEAAPFFISLKSWLPFAANGIETNDLASLAKNVKVWWGAAAAIIVLVVDRNFSPSEQDLPTSLKRILQVLCVAEIYFILNLDQAASPKYLIGAAILTLTLAGLYTYFSFVTTYHKEVTKPAPVWRIWKKDNVQEIVKVVGGRLTRTASAHVNDPNNPISTQDYFAGVAYDEDLVWSRWSRGINQTIMFLLYSAFILTAAACLVIPALLPAHAIPTASRLDPALIKLPRGEIQSLIDRAGINVDLAAIKVDIDNYIRKEISGLGPGHLAEFIGFRSGSSERTTGMDVEASGVCEKWHKRAEHHDGLLLLVGATNRAPLSTRRRYESNFGLARARAERVKSKFVDCGVPATQVLALISGLRTTPEWMSHSDPIAGFETDRAADVLAIWSWRGSDSQRPPATRQNQHDRHDLKRHGGPGSV